MSCSILRLIDMPSRRKTAHAYYGTGLSPCRINTDDIFRTVTEFGSASIPLLRWPTNYYDDLDMRDVLAPKFLNSLRGHNLPDTRDEYGGKFLATYTETLDRRFFWEFLERRRDGYGVVDAAVRIAAQVCQRAQTREEWQPQK